MNIYNGHLTRFGEEEDDDLLVACTSHVDRSMHFRCRLIPVNLACLYVELADLAAFSEFDSEPITAEDNGYPVTRIGMPGRGFTRLQNGYCERAYSLFPASRRLYRWRSRRWYRPLPDAAIPLSRS